MKKIFAVLLLLFLSACEKNTNDFDFSIEKIPNQILLYNQNYVPAGIAIPIYKDIFVAPNLIFKLDENLSWQNKKTKILIRDFSADLVFFELQNNTFLPTRLSDIPPALGETLFRFVDGEVLESVVTSVADDLDKFTVTGEMRAEKDFGAPIFDKNGKIYGILVGGNPEDLTLIFLRSDKIMGLLKESLDSLK